MREPGFSPADLRDPSDLLDKANKLKGFVQQQNSRTGRSNAKKEWMLAAQQLQDESLPWQKCHFLSQRDFGNGHIKKPCIVIIE
eukprot:1157599-Pelagomonas_calceolata.AAC.1